MAWLEDPKEQEYWEKPIPGYVSEDAAYLEEFITNEPLSAEQILSDLWIVDTNSPEAKYFYEVVQWLNNKMEKMNNDAELAVKNFPLYFQNTNQMEMRWDGAKH